MVFGLSVINRVCNNRQDFESVRTDLSPALKLSLRFFVFSLLLYAFLPSPSFADEDVRATIETSKGVIEVDLFEDKTPITVANFVNLATRGYYDGIKIHRVVSNFVIQTGDPLGTGRGGPGYKFEDEIVSGLSHSGPGILSMANSGPRTNGSQFFITRYDDKSRKYRAPKHLDGRHTVFGKVLSGQDVVDSIVQGDTMLKVEISGDWKDLLQKENERVSAWNKILDNNYPAKRGS